MKKVLFVSAIPDSGLVKVNRVNLQGRLEYFLSNSCDVYSHLKFNNVESNFILLDSNNSQTFSQNIFKDVGLIFNQISDAYGHKISLSKLKSLIKDHKIVCINNPSAIMGSSRDLVSMKLASIPGLIVPMTSRIEFYTKQELLQQTKEIGIRFPFILKRAGAHNQKGSLLLKTRNDLKKVTNDWFGSDCFIIEFIESSDKGVYSKYRVFVVDGTPFLRHVLYDNQWCVGVNSRKRFMDKNPEYWTKEKYLLKSYYENSEFRNQFLDPFRKCAEQLSLDYFGVDFTILSNGDFFIFEANPCMDNFSVDEEMGLAHWEKSIEEISRALQGMVFKRI